MAAMNNYDFNHTGVSFPRGNVEFAVNLDGPYMSEGAAGDDRAANIRFVRVTTPELPVGVSFAAFVLGNSRDMTATATAGKSVPINVICPWLPAFVLDISGRPDHARQHLYLPLSTGRSRFAGKLSIARSNTVRW